jgi:S1-C subfamily serine protease
MERDEKKKSTFVTRNLPPPSTTYDTLFAGVIGFLAAMLFVVPVLTPEAADVKYGITNQVESVRNSVVHIEKIGAWQGSGCVISKDGIIFTARHVVEGGGKFRVTLDDGQVYDAVAGCTSKEYDVGFLQIEPNEPLLAAKLADVKTLRVGEGIFVFGSPFGKRNFNSVSLGILSASHRNIDATEQSNEGWKVLFQHDAMAYPGNSGGPIFNMCGEVIGVHVAGMAPGIKYSIPVAVFKEDMQTVRTWLELSKFDVLDMKDTPQLYTYESESAKSTWAEPVW